MQTPTNSTVNVATDKRVSKLVAKAYRALHRAETTIRLLSAGERGRRLNPADCVKLLNPAERQAYESIVEAMGSLDGGPSWTPFSLDYDLKV